MAVFLVCMERSLRRGSMSTRVVSERLIVHIDFAAWMGGSFLKISPNSQRVAYVARVGTKQFVVSLWMEERSGATTAYWKAPSASARTASGWPMWRVGAKQLVVVDGNEEKHHDRILKGTLNFSPDSQRVAYAVHDSTKRFVVVDGKRDKQYDAIVTIGGGRISFDLANNLRYLARKGAAIYVVEERIKGAEECTYAGAFS